MFKYFLILRFGRIVIAAILVIGMMTFGAANSMGQESVGFKDYALYKFCADEVDAWNQKMLGGGTVNYECNDTNGGCFIMVDAIGICGSQDIRYTCADGAEVTLHSSGVLLVPDACVGACGTC